MSRILIDPGMGDGDDAPVTITAARWLSNTFVQDGDTVYPPLPAASTITNTISVFNDGTAGDTTTFVAAAYDNAQALPNPSRSVLDCLLVCSAATATDHMAYVVTPAYYPGDDSGSWSYFNIEFYGSTDGTTWTEIHTDSLEGTVGDWHTGTLAGSGTAYTYFLFRAQLGTSETHPRIAMQVADFRLYDAAGDEILSDVPYVDTTGGGGSIIGIASPELHTPVLDTAHGDGTEIRIYDAHGQRRHLPAVDVGECNWTVEPLGGYADFSLTINAEPDQVTTIAAGDLVEIWAQNQRQYRGYVSDLTRSEAEPPTLQVAGYGRVLGLERMTLVGTYQRPSATDISDLFAEIAADVQARYPGIVISTDYIGVSTQSIDARGKTAKEALDTLVGLASSVAVYGFDVDAEGRDRLYLRRINPASVDATIPIPGRNVGKREAATRVSDVVNVVTVSGGTPDFPQLLPNGSLEALTKGGQNGDSSSGDNLIYNGSFEGPTFDGGDDHDDGWILSNDASYKPNGGQEPDARTGKWSVEIDHESEKLSQTTDTPPISIVAGHQYEIGAWLRPEYSADFQEPPVVTLSFAWRIAGVDQTATTWTQTVDVATYRATSKTLAAPTGATGFHFEIELTHIHDGGGNSGVMIDDCYCIDVSAPKAASWDVAPHGDATINAINWQARGAFEGRNCLFLDVTAEDEDGQDIHIRILPNYYAGIVGGQTVRLSARIKSADGAATPKLFLVEKFYKGDGSDTGGDSDHNHEYRHTVTSDVYDGWTYVSVDFDAPGDAEKVECWITIRGSGALYIDAISARVVPDAGDESTTDTTYLPAGNLLVTYSTLDLISESENYGAYHSIEKYGIREKIESVSDITTLTDARAWAKVYLLESSVALPAPVVDLYDDQRAWAIGQMVRLSGDLGAAYSSTPLPVQRINGTIDTSGLLTHSLELGRTRPTDEELIARLARKNVYQAVQSASGASQTAIGGSQIFTTTASSGTVTSVDLSMPAGFSVTGGPVTASGTLAVSTSLSGIVKASGGAFSAATANTDYAAATHASRHGSGGADAISIDASQITSGTVSTSRLGSGTASSSTYLRGDGTWATVSGGGSGTVTSIATGTGLTGGPITTSGTISLANTAVSAGTYGDADNIPQITVDAQGRITSASTVAATGSTSGAYVQRLETGGTTITYGVEVVSVVTDTARSTYSIVFSTGSNGCNMATVVNGKATGNVVVSMSSGILTGGSITLTPGQWCRVAGVYSSGSWTGYRIG